MGSDMTKMHSFSYLIVGLFTLSALASPACNCEGESTADAGRSDTMQVYDGGSNDVTILDSTTISDSAATDSLGSDTAQQADAAIDDANIDDAALADAAIDDANIDDAAMNEDAAMPPAAPVLTSPVSGSEVSDSITVTGTGEVAALLNVSILTSQNQQFGSAETSVDSDGNFSLDVSYSGAEDNAELKVQASLTNSHGRSDLSIVNVTNINYYTITGAVSQAGTTFFGDKVYVRLYDSADEILHHIDEQIIPVNVGSRVPANSTYSFRVRNGHYHVRAFRDSFGPMSQFGPSALPDGQPTLGSDDQAPGRAIIVNNADSPDNDLVLNAAQNTDDRFAVFLAYTMNESAEAMPPYYQENNEWKPGTGLCGGYYLRFDAWRIENADANNMTLPLVETPDGSTLTMRNDSGCSEAVHDNSHHSYNRDDGPNSFSYGIPDPTEALVGDYYFYYKQKNEDLINIQVDHFDRMLKLDRRVIVTSPTGATANADLRPTITWEAIAQAGAYQVEVYSLDNSYHSNPNDDNGIVVTTNSYALQDPAPALNDNMAYHINISILDVDPTTGEDFDAMAVGTQNYFVTDSNGEHSVTISGTIINNSSATGRVLLSGSFVHKGQEQQASTLWLADATTRNYQLVLPKDLNSNPCNTGHDNGIRDCIGSVTGFVDIDASGEIWNFNGPRHNFVDQKSALDLRDDVSGTDLHFSEPVQLISPLDGASDTTSHAHFQWADYASSAAGHLPSGSWSYILYMDGPGGSQGMPDIIWGLPNTTTDFDMANPPSNSFDVKDFVTSSAAQNQTELTSGDWSWGIIVMECDYQAYIDNTDGDSNGIDDYSDCLQAALGVDQPGYASSGEWHLSLP